MAKEIRTRFAPSPTGNLHIGSARTALFNYLFAKQNKGKMVLRIEDTDTERSKKEYEEDIIQNLELLELKWDEFYKQTERLDIYKKNLQKLLEEDKAYYCFCSKEELEAQRQEQMSRGEAPKYNGKCSNISKKETEERIKKGDKCVIRFKVPNKKIKFNDLIRGEVEFDCGLLGDIVIAKDINTPLYNFAVIVDDSEMRITHVIRGEDHLPNTPKQILMQEALGFEKIEYAHLPLILGSDRSKMSKRDGATSIKEYLNQGYLPEAIINFLAFLGWNPGNNKEIFSLEELVKEFSLSKIQKSGAIFDLQKLDYLNGLYIRRRPIKELANLCIPYLISQGLVEGKIEVQSIPATFGGETIIPRLYFHSGEEISQKYIEKSVAIYQERMKKLSEIGELVDFLFLESINLEKELLRWKNMTDETVKLSLERGILVLNGIKEENWNKEFIEKILVEAAGEKRGELLWPVRVALSGKKASASPFEIADVLGKDKTLKRLNNAKNLF
jgi:glutamyl-tRNA synthetase